MLVGQLPVESAAVRAAVAADRKPPKPELASVDKQKRFFGTAAVYTGKE